MRTLILLSLMILVGCQPADPLEAIPGTLAGRPLHHDVAGQRALQAVAYLHRAGETGIDSAWIAHYGADRPSATLYAGITSSPAAAEALLDAMNEGIEARASPFRHSGLVSIDGRPVHRLDGQGQLHFVTAMGRKVIWLSVHPELATAALAGVLGIPADHPALPSATRTGDAAVRDVTLAGLGPLLRQIVVDSVLDTLSFTTALARAGYPLTPAQRQVLRGRDVPIAVKADNAAFLLNVLWTLGLANANPVLTRGPMATRSGGQVGRFASTGGWSLGRRPATHVYAAYRWIPLPAVQQRRLDTVLKAVFRPCCDNSTNFPDCNHGMAMLGLLTLLVSQGADEGALFQAAHAANRIWFPEHFAHIAAYLTDHRPGWTAETAVSRAMASGSGHARLMARAGEAEGGNAAPLPC